MPAPHDLDPPAMTENERREKRRSEIAIAFALHDLYHPSRSETFHESREKHRA